MSKIRIGPTQTDIIWEVFWHEIEACTAVMMVSISAFRSVFVAHANKSRQQQQNRNRVWYMSKKNLLKKVRGKKLGSESSEEMEERDRLPRIPRATMTGMRTFIRGGEAHEGGEETGSEGRLSAERYGYGYGDGGWDYVAQRWELVKEVCKREHDGYSERKQRRL